MDQKETKKIVKKFYGKIASSDSNCGCSCSCGNDSNESIAKSIGYSDQEIDSFSDANLGLGCGNPTALGEIKKGEVILDLGSGAGFDCFLAAKKTGDTGTVIGVDFSEEMIRRAQANAKNLNYLNVEFRLGDIEELPVADNSVDVIISNCVINLAPNKSKVFNESFRVLKKGGRMYVSDIVLLKDIPDEIKNNEELLAGCVGGAILRNEYLKIAEDAGFKIKVLSEDKEISKRQYQNIPLESLKIEAIK